MDPTHTHSSFPPICHFTSSNLCLCVCSDSGDSLFLTQNPVTKPVRPPRPSRHGKRSDLAPLEDSEVESSSSSSQGESRTPTRTPRRNRRLPSYTFRFLSGNTREDGSASPEVALPAQKNRILHVRRNTTITYAGVSFL